MPEINEHVDRITLKELTIPIQNSKNEKISGK